MILFQSHQTHNETFEAIDRCYGSRSCKCSTFHYRSVSLRLSSDSEIKIRFLSFLSLSYVGRASLCTQPFLSCSKLSFVQCMDPGQSEQGSHDGQTQRFPLFDRCFPQLVDHTVVPLLEVLFNVK